MFKSDKHALQYALHHAQQHARPSTDLRTGLRPGLRWVLCGVLMLFASYGVAQTKYPGVGRAATTAEVSAWDIDVRADFKGLPKGSGSVKRGEDVWEAKCASCHGTFGESNQTFPPLVGGTTATDIANGRVAALTKPSEGRTTLMKLSRISTLWDYINRAMPWNAPQTLSVEEVYAVTAYILSLGNVVSDDFVLSDQNMAQVQARLPNRFGLHMNHGLWSVQGKPDTNNTACMHNCTGQAQLRSELPEHARDAHGNLAEQQRLIGPTRGTVTTRTASAATSASATSSDTDSAKSNTAHAQARALATKHACFSCHGISNRLVGPSFQEIAKRNQTDNQANTKLAQKIRAGGVGAWGNIPMPAQAHLADDEIQRLVQWILSGAR